MADAVSHDHNFKNLIVEYPRQALEFFAPDEAPEPDEEATFLPVRQELLKERLGGRFRALDTPLLVEWADGRREAVVFAVEEERPKAVPGASLRCVPGSPPAQPRPLSWNTRHGSLRSPWRMFQERTTGAGSRCTAWRTTASTSRTCSAPTASCRW